MSLPMHELVRMHDGNNVIPIALVPPQQGRCVRFLGGSANCAIGLGITGMALADGHWNGSPKLARSVEAAYRWLMRLEHRATKCDAPLPVRPEPVEGPFFLEGKAGLRQAQPERGWVIPIYSTML